MGARAVKLCPLAGCRCRCLWGWRTGLLRSFAFMFGIGRKVLNVLSTAAHAKLLSHIRKENNRKERRRSEAGSQVGFAPGCLSAARALRWDR